MPWFPFRHRVFGKYGEFARIERQGTFRNDATYQPRFFTVPAVGTLFSPLTYALTVRRLIARAQLGPFDLIDAHFLFPDGAAAVLLARKLNLPVVLTARGSDVNVMLKERMTGRWIRWAVKNCDAAIGVSAALGKELTELSGDDQKVFVFRNGVDKALFSERDRDASRRALNLEGPVVLSVGNLIELKGHNLVIDAIARQDNVSLVIIGNGPEERQLRAQAARVGVESRVRFVSEITQSQLVDYYNAADVLVLASSNEGMPNVVLESMSCGTPVIATRVGGAAEILSHSKTGRLLDSREGTAIADAIADILAASPDRAAVRGEIDDFDWTTTARGIRELFSHLVSEFDSRQKSIAG